MSCHRSDSPGRISRGQQGAALVVAMLIFALAAALVVAMKSEFERFYQRSANLLSDEQVQAYLRGGEELAAMVLIKDYDEDKLKGVLRDDLGEVWAQKPQPYPVDGIGWMTGVVEDLQGRFNLNLLQERVRPVPGQEQRFTAAQQQFIRLLQALGEPPVSEQEAIAITEAISDWLDDDAEPSPDGAEDTYYSSRTPPYRAANRLFSSVSELRAVANMTPEIYQALSPWVAALPGSTKLNIHTAPAMVLRSINEDDNLSPLSEDEGESLRSEVFEDINGFLGHPVFASKKEKMSGVRRLLGESSTYFLLQATAEVAGREMRLYSVLERRNRTIVALARANGSL